MIALLTLSLACSNSGSGGGSAADDDSADDDSADDDSADDDSADDDSLWSSMTSGTKANLSGVWGSSATDVFAVGDSGTILHYDGSSWSPMTSGTKEELGGVWGSSASDVFAVGSDIFHYDGFSWSAMTSGWGGQIRGVWGSSATDVFAVDKLDAVYHYDGSSWSSMIGTPPELEAVWGTSHSDVFAVGFYTISDTDILHYDGSSWSAMTSGTTAHLCGVWGSSATDVFAVGDGTILHYDGSSWSSMSGTDWEDYLWGIWGSSATDVFAVGASGRIMHYDGSSWSYMTPPSWGVSFSGVWGSSSSDVFAVGSYGTILHYGGNSGSDDDAVNDDDASDDDTTPDDDTTGDDDTTPDDDTVDDDTVGLTWVSIPAGTYWMGCEPQDTNCNANENPRHQVTLSAFQITQADITQAQYQAVTGTNPSYFQPPSYPSCPDCPVEQVTWYNADDYCAAVGGRLVTEAEWEYAARAGTSTIYICGDDPSCLDSIAWYSSNSGDTTHPVCQKAPNVWGLCDMAGDVFQWVNDWYDANYYSVSPTDDPPGPATGVYHVLRAGSWNNAYDYYLRASARDCLNPDYAVMNDGFRCARD